MKKEKSLLIVFLLLLLIGVGYSIISSDLSIRGTSKIPSVSWDVHFENVQTTSNSNVSPTTIPSTPIDSKTTTISYDVTLNNPGDIYEFSVDVKNAGTIDAKVDSFLSTIKIGNGVEDIVSSSTVPEYLTYYVRYIDGTSINTNDLLKASQSKKILVHVEFNDNISSDVLNEALGKNISFKVTINYKQAN